MKIKTILLLLATLVTYSSYTYAENKTPHGTLTVNVLGLPSSQGTVRFGLYHSKESYNARKGALRVADLIVSNKQCIWTITDLPYGEYAVMLYHDENDNHKIDKNFLGIPKEGFGFSNDAEPGFGAPYYSESKFNFNQAQQSIEINLQ